MGAGVGGSEGRGDEMNDMNTTIDRYLNMLETIDKG